MATKKFGWLTVWFKGALAGIMEEYDIESAEGIAISGNLSVKADEVHLLAEYLLGQEPDAYGYVKCDLALFFAGPKAGDLRGSISEQYKKEGSTVTVGKKKAVPVAAGEVSATTDGEIPF